MPSTPATGDLAVDSGDDNTLKQYDGTAWRKMAAAAAALTGGAILQGGGNNQITTIPSTGSGDVVRANSPVIATPSIASFAGANHDHSNAASGGPISNTALPNTFDISGKASTRSVKTGTAAPGNCAVGELFYDTDATAGQNLYGCTSTNVWTLLGDGGGGGGGITSFGGQTGASQTFANDVNVTIASSANTHTLGWSGTLSKPRQDPATVYTDQGNTWSAGVQDFSAAISFRGKTGDSEPPACAPGELFFNTVQNVQMACTEPNVWTPLRAVAPGAGVTLVHSASTTTVSADTAVMLSQATNQANISKYCADSGSTDTYTCDVTPALTTYTTGMFDIFRPNSSNTGATTKDISGVGTRNIKLADGTTDPPDTTLVGGRFYGTVYDGSSWRTMQSIVSGGNVSGILPADNGGTGLNSSASTGVPRLTSGAWSFDAGFSHLSNVAHNHQDAAGGGQLDASSVFSAGVVPAARLGSGTANSTTFLRGDQTWATPTGGGSGDVVGPASATDNAIARFDATTGKLIQNSSATVSDAGIVTASGFASSGGGAAGLLELTQGTACTPSANSVCIYAPTSITTAYGVVAPSAVGATGVVKVSVNGAVATLSHAALADADVPNDITVDAATLAGTVTVVDSTDATSFVAIFDSATGSLPVKTDAGLTYNASTASLAATTFVGALTGTASGNTITVASGTKALDTDAIASGACDTLSTTTATGVASTDAIQFTPNADITAVTGYAPVTTGGLAIYAWPTANTINWKVCNPTSSSITPGAVTLNYRVTR